MHPSGVKRRYDNIRSCFLTLFEKVGWNKPIKLMRKTSASELANKPEFAPLVDVFLAHSPTGMADRHNVRLDDTILDAAIAYLRTRYLE